MAKKSIRKRTAAINIAKSNLQSPEYLLNDIMGYVTSREYPAITMAMVPILMKLKAKYLEEILNGYLDEEDAIHVKTT